MNKQGKIYHSVDFAKLICAFLIIFIHTYCFEPWGAWIKYVICPLAVPFFFIASGFFLEKGLQNKNRPEYIRNYFGRIFSMYCIWTLLTLPVSWMNVSRAHADYSTTMHIIYLAREFFFSGSLGIYWYLLCLLYGCAVIYWLDKYHWLKIGSCIAALLFTAGVILNCGIGWNSWYGRFTHIIFGSTRNPFNEGIFYMLIGFGISRMNIHVKPLFSSICFVISLLIAFFLYQNTTIQIMQLFLALSAFLLTIELDISPLITDGTSIRIRQLSTALYLLQFPFILLFDYYLRNSTLIDYSTTLAFCIAVYTACRLMLPAKINKVLYG